ncbi:hypothetical protein L6R53_10870 [Myxococcota bacterium]|nr:hypothetical protein [Myxococcota bacterium]
MRKPALLIALLLIGCRDKGGDDTGTDTDGGATDGGTGDGGTGDGGTGDGGTGDGGTGDGGTGDGGTGDGGTGDGGVEEVSFLDDVYPLLVAHNCADCHSDDTWHPGLLLTDAATTYNTLLNDAPDDPSVWTAYVVPGNPAVSLLMPKLSEDDPAYGGDRMPKDGSGYMTADDLETIETWILQGAFDN